MQTKLNEPLLMQSQNGALNCDTYAQNEFKQLQQKFKLTTAIETGTCLGYTTEFLSIFYNKVKTVEINANFLNIAKVNRLNECPNVETNLGSSADLMANLLNGCTDDTFIFLDAHWGEHCPLKDELRGIANSGLKPVIAIHDFVVPGHPELGFDMIGNQPFTYEWLKPEFDNIYGANNYNHYYNSEAVGAKRGIIYITPIR